MSVTEAHIGTTPAAPGRRWIAALLLTLSTLATAPLFAAGGLATRNVVLVTLDGVRMQEIFGGLDDTIAAHDAQHTYSEMAEMRARYGGDSPAARREALLPNFWKTLAPAGMVLGNAAHGNRVRVENRVLWSTPGYTEMLTGRPRLDVVDNSARRYPYRTALEFARDALDTGPAGVAEIGSWDGYRFAAASRDDAFLMLGAYDAPPEKFSTPELDLLATLRREVMGLWTEGSDDMLTFRMAQGLLEKNKPRVLWIALVNSDDWAHADRYDRYLEYLHRADAMLGELWATLQSTRAYRGSTTLIVTTDHGRGLTGGDWAEHDITIPGSDAIWLGVFGPDTPDTGEVTEPGTAWQGQVAATLLQFLGLDYRQLGSDVLPPVAGTLRR